MPKDTREWKVTRHKLLQECKAMLDKADAEKRTLTATEKYDHDEKLKAAEEWRVKIEKQDAQNDLEREEHAARNRMGGGFRRFNSTPIAESLREGCDGFRMIDQFGQEHRALAHHESVRSVVNCKPDGLSLGRLLRGVVTGIWDGAAEERASYGKGLDVTGGFLLTPAMSADVIDATRAASVVSAAGARTVVIPDGADALHLARVETRPTAYWTAEKAEITESEGTFGRVTLNARSLACYCEASLELWRDAPNAPALIEKTIAESLALALDSAALNGAIGDGNITGLKSSTDVTDYPVGGALTFDHILKGFRVLYNNNMEPKAAIYDANMRAFIERLKDGEGQYYDGPKTWAALPKYMTTQLQSTAENSMYVGDFSNCIFGLRQAVEIQVSPFSGDTFKKKMIAIRGWLRADFGICRSGDVVKLSGVTNTTG